MIELSVLHTIQLASPLGPTVPRPSFVELRKAEVTLEKRAYVLGLAFHPFEEKKTRDINFFHHARDRSVICVNWNPIRNPPASGDGNAGPSESDWLSDGDMLALSQLIPLSLFCCICLTMPASTRFMVSCEVLGHDPISLDIVGCYPPIATQDPPP